MRTIALILLMAGLPIALQGEDTGNPGRWSGEKADEWYSAQPWPCGFNYIPANAISYTEMWMPYCFDATLIDKELALAEGIGFNCLRVVLPFVVWEHDPKAFKERLGTFLSVCEKRGIKVMFCLFDDCAFGSDEKLKDPWHGKQPEVLKGWYASGWTPSPGHSLVRDPKSWPRLEKYVKDLIGTFKDDPRVWVWDLYNEPTNGGLGDISLPLVTKVFAWARAMGPSQPLTVAQWNGNGKLNAIIHRHSDIVTFHQYGKAAALAAGIESLKSHGRPIINTEWLNRGRGSTVETCLPVFAEEAVGCMHWGLVNGKTQTNLGWGWRPGRPEPKVWQHDLYHGDHTPYEEKELGLFRKRIEESRESAPTKQRPPNFIFVLSDDIAQGDLGCYGQELIQTPRLDRMAAEGTRYLQAYCGTSVCAPSRSSFFTGLHAGHCPVRGNYEVPPEGQLPLPAETVTIAEVAKEAAYATATFGKWGMGFFDSTGSPFKQGVDHFFGYNCQRHAHSYFPTYLYDDAQPFLLPGNDGRGVGKTYAQELIQNDMIRWLKAHAEQPFLMFYAITLPHGRHEIDDFGIYQDKPWSDKEKAYAAQVTRVDSDMGELVDTLRELGIEKNTLVVFSGDNGSSFPPDSEIGKRFNQARNGLRGFKRGMYEGALRQAAFAWWPGTVPAGRVDEQPWAFWDLMPTFVEMSGAKPPQGYETDGLSLLDYLKGGQAPERDYFYWELHPGNHAVQAARFENWKAVRNGPHKPIEIYDLAKDSTESNDLAKSRPNLVKRAQQIFTEAHRPDPNWPLDHRSKKHVESSREAWKIKKWRDKNKWVPENARPAGQQKLSGTIRTKHYGVELAADRPEFGGFWLDSLGK